MRKRAQDILVEEGKVAPADVARAEALALQSNQDLGAVLVQMGAVSPTHWVRACSQAAGIPFVDLAELKLDVEVVKLVPQRVAIRHKLIPISQIENRLTVAMKNPLDVIAIDEVKLITGMEVEPLYALEEDIQNAITQYYGITLSIEAAGGLGADLDKVVAAVDVDQAEEVDAVELRALVEEAPVVRLVNAIIAQAIRERASDIHIEPLKTVVRIRFRVDGVMHEVMSPDRKILPVLVSRIKIMAKMDIAERRIPQDGRIDMIVEGREFDFRVSTYPTIFGEKVVMRILDKSGTMIGLDKLGFPAATQAIFEDLVENPHGILLVTGPTGSGKTTTLYSVLNKLNTIEKNIVTVEDPIEYQMEGINQIQVNPKAGLRFDNALRSLVRQDPDIIMVGEIRDTSTAEIAINASLTGHLVLSTLHTNDAPGASVRLVDMGIEPYLVASGLSGVLAQRLVRKICERCKESYEAPAKLLTRFGYRVAGDKVTLYRGKGCDACRGTGYTGRVGIFELMSIDDNMREMIAARKSAVEIKEAARKLGMKTLQEDCLERVVGGTTTIDEAFRVVYVEEAA